MHAAILSTWKPNKNQQQGIQVWVRYTQPSIIRAKCFTRMTDIKYWHKIVYWNLFHRRGSPEWTHPMSLSFGDWNGYSGHFTTVATGNVGVCPNWMLNLSLRHTGKKWRENSKRTEQANRQKIRKSYRGNQKNKRNPTSTFNKRLISPSVILGPVDDTALRNTIQEKVAAIL
jgi:hypothetical protein